MNYIINVNFGRCPLTERKRITFNYAVIFIFILLSQTKNTRPGKLCLFFFCCVVLFLFLGSSFDSSFINTVMKYNLTLFRRKDRDSVTLRMLKFQVLKKLPNLATEIFLGRILNFCTRNLLFLWRWYSDQYIFQIYKV